MKLLIASNNAHKVTEIHAILASDFPEMITLKEAGLDIEVDEDGTTFEENAAKKAEETLERSGYDAVLADDSGLMVDHLGGAPGVYSARFAGVDHDFDANNRKLVAELDGVPNEKRTAHFVTVIALARRGQKTLIARGSVDGTITTEAHGTNGFGYDPFFFYAPYGKTFAELTAEEKNGVSHRRRALEALKKALDAEKNA